MHGSRRKPLKTFLPLAAAMLLAQAAHAECTSPNLNISGDFCKDCVYEGTMVVPRDQACQRLYRPSPANPVGSILSATMMLRDTFGLGLEADWVEQSVARVLGAGYRTEDIAEPGTKKVGASMFLEILHQEMQRTFEHAEKYGWGV